MENEDVLELPQGSPVDNEGNELSDTTSGKPGEMKVVSCSMEDEEGLIRDDLVRNEGKVEDEDRPYNTLDSGLDNDLVSEPSTVQMNVKLVESIEASESSRLHVEKGFITGEDHSQKTTHVRDVNCILILCLLCSFICSFVYM